jgi:hypothetical protein
MRNYGTLPELTYQYVGVLRRYKKYYSYALGSQKTSDLELRNRGYPR